MIHVSGEQNGVPTGALYKCRKAALRFAEKLSNSEVYDKLTKEYIGGTSKWAKLMMATVEEMKEISEAKKARAIDRSKRSFENI